MLMLPSITQFFTRIPGGLGTAVQDTGSTSPQTVSPTPSTPATPPAQEPGKQGVDPGVSDPVQPSPQDTQMPIQDTSFYQLDPSDPKTRIAGLELREAVQRGRQVDTLQSQLHTTQNANKAMQEQLTSAQAQLEQIKRDQSVTEKLKSLGFLGTGQQPVQAPASPQIQTPAPDEQPVGDLWRNADDPNPNEPVVNPPVNPGQNVALDADQFARNLLPIIDEAVARQAGNIQALVDAKTQESMAVLTQERATQDQIRTTMQTARNLRAEGLKAKGLDDVATNNILDLEDMATGLMRQAESLISVGGETNLNAAYEKISQAEKMSSKAIEDRVVASVTFQQELKQKQFASQIDRDPFAAMNIEPLAEDAGNLAKPADIEARNKAVLDKAQQLVSGRELLGKT